LSEDLKKWRKGDVVMMICFGIRKELKISLGIVGMVERRRKIRASTKGWHGRYKHRSRRGPRTVLARNISANNAKTFQMTKPRIT
jgi:hypothetical protein